MNRTALTWSAGAVGLAIVALLLYSLDRTAWLFRLYETGQQHADTLGLAAAIVVELAAVALIAGDALAEALTRDRRAADMLRAWAGRGLAAVLGAQILANLIAGYLRGGRVLLTALGGPGDWPPLVLAGTAWLVTNALIPGLVFILAKIEARLLTLLIGSTLTRPRAALTRTGRAVRVLPATALTVNVSAQAAAIAADTAPRQALPGADIRAQLAAPAADTPAPLLTDDSKRQRVAALAAEHGVSERTIWRRIKDGKLTL